MSLWIVWLTACSESHLTAKEAEAGLRELRVEPLAVDFGLGAPGEGSEAVITVASLGEAAVEVSGFELTGAPFQLVSPAEVVLSPGEVIELLVSWLPTDLADRGQLTVRSDAVQPTVVVPLSGAADLPAITVSPPSLGFLSAAAEQTEDVVVSSVGTQEALIDIWALSGPFTGEGEALPLTLPPGASTTISVTWDPADGGGTGALSIASNTPSSPTVVPIDATVAEPCVGLGEAIDRGLVRATTDADFQLALINDDATTAVCVDDWYVYLSPESQDYAAGDQDYAALPYPLGTTRINPWGSVTYANYGPREGFFCVERPQWSKPEVPYSFTGGRVPAPLREWMIGGGAEEQEAIWTYQDQNPVIVAGRHTNWASVGAEGGVVPVVVRALNLGDRSGEVELREAVPAGWGVHDVDPPATRIEARDDGGQVIVWEAQVPQRSFAGAAEDVSFGYSLDVPPCSGTQVLPELEARWVDAAGRAVVSTANPLVIACGGS